MTPKQKYRALLEQSGFAKDPAQERVIELLDDLHQRLRARSAPRTGLLGRLFGRARTEAEPITGLYLWGGVGRGKTLMMDLFYECLPENDRQRMHFHRF